MTQFRKQFKKHLDEMEASNKKMSGLMSIFPCSVKEAKIKWPDLDWRVVDDAISENVSLTMDAWKMLGLPCIAGPTNPIHLIRHAIKLGYNPVMNS